MSNEERYFIVNPKGAVHEVSKEHAEQRIADDPRYRMATKAEVEAYLAAAVQTAEAPIGKPYVPKGEKRITVKPNG